MPPLRWTPGPPHEKSPAPPLPTPCSSRTPEGNGAPSPRTSLPLTCPAEVTGPRRAAEPESRTVGRPGGVEVPSLPAGRRTRPRLPERPEGSTSPKPGRSSISSSAARRGVAQRVLILSRPRRFSRVFGGTRHPALRVRQVSPFTAFAPNPRPPGEPRARPRRPRPIASARRGSQGGAGGGGERGPEVAGRIPGGKAARKSVAHLRWAALLGWRAEHRAD